MGGGKPPIHFRASHKHHEYPEQGQRGGHQNPQITKHAKMCKATVCHGMVNPHLERKGPLDSLQGTQYEVCNRVVRGFEIGC